MARRTLSALSYSRRLFAGHRTDSVDRMADPVGNCHRVDRAAHAMVGWIWLVVLFLRIGFDEKYQFA